MGLVAQNLRYFATVLDIWQQDPEIFFLLVNLYPENPNTFIHLQRSS